jgi:hypothetical protein
VTVLASEVADEVGAGPGRKASLPLSHVPDDEYDDDNAVKSSNDGSAAKPKAQQAPVVPAAAAVEVAGAPTAVPTVPTVAPTAAGPTRASTSGKGGPHAKESRKASTSSTASYDTDFGDEFEEDNHDTRLQETKEDGPSAHTPPVVAPAAAPAAAAPPPRLSTGKKV